MGEAGRGFHNQRERLAGAKDRLDEAKGDVDEYKGDELSRDECDLDRRKLTQRHINAAVKEVEYICQNFGYGKVDQKKLLVELNSDDTVSLRRTSETGKMMVSTLELKSNIPSRPCWKEIGKEAGRYTGLAIDSIKICSKYLGTLDKARQALVISLKSVQRLLHQSHAKPIARALVSPRVSGAAALPHRRRRKAEKSNYNVYDDPNSALYGCEKMVPKGTSKIINQ